jgi:hypothetical protein
MGDAEDGTVSTPPSGANWSASPGRRLATAARRADTISSLLPESTTVFLCGACDAYTWKNWV